MTEGKRCNEIPSVMSIFIGFSRALCYFVFKKYSLQGLSSVIWNFGAAKKSHVNSRFDDFLYIRHYDTIHCENAFQNFDGIFIMLDLLDFF